MRKNTPADELRKDYDPVAIGERIFHLVKEENMTLKGFAALVTKMAQDPFGKIDRYIKVREMKLYDNEDIRTDSLYENMGLFFLDFAYTSYIVSFILRTDPQYLAFGVKPRDGIIFQTQPTEKTGEGESFLKYQISQIDPMLISDRIRTVRKLNDKTTREAAEEIKVSLVTYLGYENALYDKPHRFSYPVFFQFCKAMDVHADYVMLGKSIKGLYSPYDFSDGNLLGYIDKRKFPDYSSMDELWDEYQAEIAYAEGNEDYGYKPPEPKDFEFPITDGKKLKTLSGENRAYFLKRAFLAHQEFEKEMTVYTSYNRIVDDIKTIKKAMPDWTAEDLIVVREMTDKWVVGIWVDEPPVPYNPPDYAKISHSQATEAENWIRENLVNMTPFALTLVRDLVCQENEQAQDEQ